jgi:uncharacterized membrane protein YeaQ/YmgE (transglycosylase-associated protein family)
MDIILQIIFGTYVGWMSSRPGIGKFWNIGLGILGAIAGSLLISAFGLFQAYGYNFQSFFVSMTGAVSAIQLGRLLFRLPQTKNNSI